MNGRTSLDHDTHTDGRIGFITSLRPYNCSARTDLELGDLMVVDTLDINSATMGVVAYESHVVACNTTVGSPVDQRLEDVPLLGVGDKVGIVVQGQ